MALAEQADTSYRRDWGAAFKAVRALLADPNDTVQVFRIMAALNGASSRTGYQRLLKTRQGARIAYRRPELVERLRDRAWLDRFEPGTVVIAEPQRAFSGGQFQLVFPQLTHYGIELWVPELGGRIDPDSEGHEMLMSLFGGLSKAERRRLQIRTRNAMLAHAAPASNEWDRSGSTSVLPGGTHCVRETITTSADARCAQPRFTSASASKMGAHAGVSRCPTMNRHGCELNEDGAQRAASRKVDRVSRGIGSPVKALGDQRRVNRGSIG